MLSTEDEEEELLRTFLLFFGLSSGVLSPISEKSSGLNSEISVAG